MVRLSFYLLIFFLFKWTQNARGLPVVDVILDAKFTARLQAHQCEGVKFIYKCLMGFQTDLDGFDRFKTGNLMNKSINVYGCILA